MDSHTSHTDLIARCCALALGLAVAASPAAALAAATPEPNAVLILRQEGRWTGLWNRRPLTENESDWYVISGELRNVGARRIAYIRLSYDLLDERDAVVASEFSYNWSAEDLRRPDYEAGQVRREDLDVRPLEPGAIDMFRMLFIRSETPKFHHWRVRVLDIGYED